MDESLKQCPHKVEMPRALVAQLPLLDNLTEGVSLADENGTIIYTNAAADALLGCEAGELLGKQLDLEIDATRETPYRSRALLEELLKNRRWEGEGSIRDKNGSLFTIATRVSSINVDGKAYFLSNQRDITEQKFAKRLTAIQSAITAILSHAPSRSQLTYEMLALICTEFNWDVGNFYLLNSERGVLQLESQWRGRQVEEFDILSRTTVFRPGVGLPGRVLTSSQTVWVENAYFEENFPRRAAAQIDGLHGGVGFPILNGETVVGVMEFFSSDIRNSDALLVSVFAALGSQIGTYLSRLSTQEELVEAQRRSAAIVKAALDAIVTIDAEHEITGWEGRAEEVFGWTRDEALGRKLYDLIIPEPQRESHRRGMQILLQTGKGPILNKRLEVSAVRKGQEETFPVELTVTALNDNTFTGFVRDISSQRLAERAAEAERNRLRDLLMHAPANICVQQGPEHVYELANPQYLQLIGRRDPKMVLGRRVRSVLPELAGQGFFELLDEVYATGNPFIGNEMHVQLDPLSTGTYQDCYVNFVYQPLRNSAGEIYGIMTHATDVTEQVLARQQVEVFAEALAEERDRLRAIIDGAEEFGILLMDPGLRITNWSVGAELICGWSREEALDQHGGLIFTPEDVRQGAPEQERDIAARAGRAPDERWHMRKDGTRFWGSGVLHAIFDDHGNTRAYVKVFRDTTDRKKMEQALADSERQLRFVLDSMPQKVFTARPGGEVIYFNPIWMEFTGLTFEEIKGWGWTQFIHPDDVSGNVRAWEHALKTGEPFYFEHRFRRADGEYRWHVSRAFPFRDENGQIELWIGSNSDVDDLRRSDEVLRERLEEEVRRRTDDLIQVNEQLQGFTYSVAHDLRQQIRGISANAAMLLLDTAAALDEDSRDTLRRLADSAKKLGTLVNDLLDYARLGRQEPKMLTLDLTAIAEEVVELLIERGSCTERTHFTISPGLRSYGDPTMLRVVFQNLLENACKFSAKQAHPSIEVGQIGSAIFVKDNGVGFDMRFANKLFQPFERLHDAAEYAGTGIGLANVRRIIEKHNGRVWAESELGTGARFLFTLSDAY